MSRWRWTDLALTHIFAGFLPTVGRPSAVALVSYFSFDVDHLVYCHSKVSSLVQGTFTPQQSRPCRAYPMRCTTSGEVQFFEVVDHSSPPRDRRRSPQQ